jgi:predicted nucleic acid-binding Zn ribbon protein
MEKIKKTCLQCGKEVIGRADKLFCEDRCRNNYNNDQKKDATNLMRNVNNKLRKNYNILLVINPRIRAKTSKQKLIKKGFDFETITRVETAKTGITYYFVYDQVYHELEDDNFIVFKADM